MKLAHANTGGCAGSFRDMCIWQEPRHLECSTSALQDDPFSSPSRLPFSHHGADIAPLHLPETEEEPFPDRSRELLFRDGIPAEGLVEPDEHQGRMDIDLLVSAGINQGLHHLPGIPLPAVFIQREDAVHLVSVRVPGEPGGGGQVPVVKDPEDPFGCRIGLLAAVLLPDFFCEGEF